MAAPEPLSLGCHSCVHSDGLLDAHVSHCFILSPYTIKLSHLGINDFLLMGHQSLGQGKSASLLKMRFFIQPRASQQSRNSQEGSCVGGLVSGAGMEHEQLHLLPSTISNLGLLVGTK